MTFTSRRRAIALESDQLMMPPFFIANNVSEKYMKARLEEAGLSIARTHDLLTLYQEVLNVEPGWLVLQPFFAFLTPFAVAFATLGSRPLRATPRMR
jgi:hypothetical protein